MSASSKTAVRMPSAERRATIERSAARLFAAYGYEETTIAAIATEVGVTKPIIYRHFDSKDDLYLALLDRHAARLAEFPTPTASELAREELLVGLLDGWFAYAAENPHVWRMVFEDGGGGAAISRRRREMRTTARTLLANLIGSARPGLDPRRRLACAEQLRSGLVGLTLWWFDHPDLDRREVVAIAAEATFPALAVARGPSG